MKYCQLILSALVVAVICCCLLSPVAAQNETNSTSTTTDATPGVFCYVCNEIHDSGCADLTNGDQFIKQCSNNVTFCRKTIQEVDGLSTVLRQCAKNLNKEKDDYHCIKHASGKSTQHVCECRGETSKDKKPCNPSSTPLASPILIMALFVVSLIFF